MAVALVDHVVEEQMHYLAESHLFVVVRVNYLEHAVLLGRVLRPF